MIVLGAVSFLLLNTPSNSDREKALIEVEAKCTLGRSYSKTGLFVPLTTGEVYFWTKVCTSVWD